MKQSTATVKTQKGKTDIFEINKGVRQGDSLSTTLFNLALGYVVRDVDKGNLLRTRGGQLIAYADDLVLVAKKREIMEKMFQEIVEEGEKWALK